MKCPTCHKPGYQFPRSSHYYETDGSYLAPSAIVDAVAKLYNTTPVHVLGPSRKPEYAIARHLVAYLVRVTTKMSFPEIGLLLGRDHSTIVHSVNHVIAKRIAEDPDFAARVETLLRSLRVFNFTSVEQAA